MGAHRQVSHNLQETDLCFVFFIALQQQRCNNTSSRCCGAGLDMPLEQRGINDVGYKMHCKENNQCFYWILKDDARARSVSRGDSSTQLF